MFKVIRRALAIIFSLILFFFLFSLFFYNKKAYAQKPKQSFITIVNPVRVSPYTINLKESIEAQYLEIKNRDFPATWLLSFDVLNNKDAAPSFRKFDNRQELGIFMEVSSISAKAAGVAYNKRDSWHRATSIFLPGYSQNERIKLIDSVFEKFKDEFGYYPASVGAWWIDSFSLDYMSRKYKVMANLNVSDQAGTDGYHVWGTYWSTPYYPSKINAAFPASSTENKLNIATLRWAHRDPLNGYISPDKRESTRFSTQDYFTIGLTHDYFEQLLRFYTDRDFGQITIGLEGDFPAETYNKNFSTQLSIAQKLVSEGGIELSTMKNFAIAYMHRYKNFSPEALIESSDILGSSRRIYWFQNPKYRVGIIHDFKDNKTQIVDLRAYYQDFQEPFYVAANKQYDLFSIVPSIIDSTIEPDLRITLDTGVLIASNNNSITFEKGKLVFEEDVIKLNGIRARHDPRLLNSGLVGINSSGIYLSQKYPYSPDGYIFREYLPKIPFALKSRISVAAIYFALIIFILSVIVFSLILRKRNPKYYQYFVVCVGIIFLIYGFLRFTKPLFVSQSEIDALFVLKNLTNGKVLLYDKNCLRCQWSSKNKPAAMEGRKDYVKKLSSKETNYSLEFVLARNPDEAKEIIKKTKVKYIYLTKHEDYIESLSFAPEDLGIDRVYENANAAIYEVK